MGLPQVSKTFTVTMLAVLREPFEQWCRANGLILEQTPQDRGTNQYIAVPHPDRTELDPSDVDR